MNWIPIATILVGFLFGFIGFIVGILITEHMGISVESWLSAIIGATCIITIEMAGVILFHYIVGVL